MVPPRAFILNLSDNFSSKGYGPSGSPTILVIKIFNFVDPKPDIILLLVQN